MVNNFSAELVSIGVIIVFITGLVIGLNYQKQLPVDSQLSQQNDQPLSTDQFDSRPTPTKNDQKAELTRQFPVQGDDRLTIDLKSIYQITAIGQNINTLSFSITGPQELIDRLNLEKRHGEIFFEEVVSQQPNISVQEGLIGQITLPTSIAITLKISGAGQIKVTDHLGRVTIASDGSTKVEFSNTTSQDPIIEAHGSSRVLLDRCQGNAEIKTSGAADFTVNQCTIKRLIAEASGASHIKIRSGSIEQAKLEASEASNIKIPQVSQKLEQHSSGASSIELR